MTVRAGGPPNAATVRRSDMRALYPDCYLTGERQDVRWLLALAVMQTLVMGKLTSLEMKSR